MTKTNLLNKILTAFTLSVLLITSVLLTTSTPVESRGSNMVYQTDIPPKPSIYQIPDTTIWGLNETKPNKEFELFAYQPKEIDKEGRENVKSFGTIKDPNGNNLTDIESLAISPEDESIVYAIDNKTNKLYKLNINKVYSDVITEEVGELREIVPSTSEGIPASAGMTRTTIYDLDGLVFNPITNELDKTRQKKQLSTY